MKRLLLFGVLFSLFFVLGVGSAQAATCTPDTGFDNCYQNEYNNNDARAYAEVQTTDIYSWFADNKRYYDSSKPLKAQCVGTRFYLYDQNEVSVSQAQSSCGESGCSGAVATLPVGREVTVDLAAYSPIEPLLLCYDYEEANGWWAYTFQSIYWGSTYYEVQQECTSNDQCGDTQYCNYINAYENTCDELVCAADEYIENHLCVSPEFPQLCTDAGITDLAACQAYVNEYLGVLEGDLQQKVDTINQLELTLEEKQAFINDLNATIQEKAQVIDQLELTLEEQAATINQLSQKADEQAQYIEELTANIEEQAALIDQLTTNLEQKSALVNELQAENEFQADLIAQLNESLSNQGAIIDELNKEVQDDAEIIGRLTDKTDEQAEIIAGMRRTNEEQRALIAELRDSLEEEEELRAELQSVIDRQQNIIQNLRDEAQQNLYVRVLLLLGGVALGAGAVYGYIWYRRRRR